MRRLLVTAGLLGCALLPATASADPVVYYASPGGTDDVMATCTSPLAACELQTAMGKAATDDIVELAAGIYTENNGDGYELAKQIILRGAAGGARPLLKSTMDNEGGLELTQASAAGATLQHLAFESPLNSYALTYNQGQAVENVTLKDIAIDSPGYCVNLPTTLVENSTFRSNSLTAGGVACATFPGAGTVRNVTIEVLSDQPGLALGQQTAENVRVTSAGAGVQMLGGSARRLNVRSVGDALNVYNAATVTDSILLSTAGRGLYTGNGTATLRNVTAVGSAAGLYAVSSSVPAIPPARIVGTNVIARGSTSADDVVTPVAEADCLLPECDGTAELKYSNLRTSASSNLVFGPGNQAGDPLFVSATDLHLQAGSPARNAGTADGVDSVTDVDGDARTGEGTIDIGGDEYVVPPATPTPTPTASATATATATVSPTATATPDTTAPTLKAKGKKKGKVAVTLSERASLKIAIAKKKGRKFKRKGTQTVRGAAGSSTITIKLKSKKLKPGKYKLTIVATDEAGNAGAPVIVKLKVKASNPR